MDKREYQYHLQEHLRSGHLGAQEALNDIGLHIGLHAYSDGFVYSSGNSHVGYYTSLHSCTAHRGTLMNAVPEPGDDEVSSYYSSVYDWQAYRGVLQENVAVNHRYLQPPNWYVD
jgi:hypothetical protein